MAASPPKTLLGYVLSLAVAENVFMGGLLVTDGAGLPAEFRYTEPVRATKLQRVLYGDALERFLHGDVVAASLLEKLDSKPDLFLVSEPLLLPTVGGNGRRAACLLPTRAAPLREYGAEQDADGGDLLLQMSDNGSPLRLRVLPETEPARRAETVRMILDAGRLMDILEPAARVDAAVRMLWQDAPETPVEAVP